MTVLPLTNLDTVTRSFLQDVSPRNVLAKVKKVALECIKCIAATFAALFGLSVGICGGAVLITAGGLWGMGSLALQMIHLYALCIKDSSSACFYHAMSLFE